MSEIIIKAILLSMLPIAELRGGIPYAIANDVDVVTAYFCCVGANLMAFPITYFFLSVFHVQFMKIELYRNLFDKFVARTRSKVEKEIDKYGFWGLMVFVMIPLPVTGAYTGSFAAWLFGFPKSKGFASVGLGVVIAGIIVTLISVSGIEAFQFLLKKI